jgi:small subunit ribosomal protein S20e
MTDVVKKGGEVAQQHKIRITLSSRNAAAIEKVCSDLLAKAKEHAKQNETLNIKVAGPMRMPTRTLKIITRKTPCGNGTNTWDRYEMKIFKRVVDIYAPQDQIRALTNIQLENGVDFDVVVGDV